MASRRLGLRITRSTERGRRLLEVLPPLLREHAARAFSAMARDWENAMRARFTAPSDPRREFLHNRSGMLQRSLKARVEGQGTLSGLRLRAFSSGVIYARLQELGGTIRPTGGRQFLAIPIADNLTPAGVARYPSAAGLRDNGPLKTWVQRGKNGGLFIMGSKPGAEGGKPLLLFALRRQVYVPPRLGFRKTFAALGERRRFLLQAALARAAKEAEARV